MQVTLATTDTCPDMPQTACHRLIWQQQQQHWPQHRAAAEASCAAALLAQWHKVLTPWPWTFPLLMVISDGLPDLCSVSCRGSIQWPRKRGTFLRCAQGYWIYLVTLHALDIWCLLIDQWTSHLQEVLHSRKARSSRYRGTSLSRLLQTTCL